MSLRISDAAIRHVPTQFLAILAVLSAVLAAGCGPAKPDDATVTRTETAARAAAGEILCARGDAPLEKICTLAREQTPQGLTLTIDHPDGGFRRLRVTTDGRGVVAADGAEPAIVLLAGDDAIDVRIGSDHFRLPATIAQPPSS
jgi:hypothetical protein